MPEEFEVGGLFEASDNTPRTPQKTEVVDIDPNAGVWDKKTADGLLAKYSKPIDLSNSNLGKEIPVGKFIKHQKSIIFTNNSGTFIIPDSTQSRSLMESGEYTEL